MTRSRAAGQNDPVAASAPQLVNPVAAQELDGWIRSMASTFLGDPHAPAIERRIEELQRVWDPARVWGVRDRGRWVATLRSEPRTITVPGAGAATLELAADAVTNVTVSATHRRRGLMARMLGGSLQAARERGDAVSVLIAAEWAIYGRFGYAPATLSAEWTLHRSRAGAGIAGDLTCVRHVERAQFAEVAAEVYAAARRGRAGQIDRSAGWWERRLGRDGVSPGQTLPDNWLVHEGDDGPDGLLAWTATREMDLLPPLGTVEVADLAAATDAAYVDLWAYLTGLDGVDLVRLPDRPIDEPARFLSGNGRSMTLERQIDFLWLKLLDVPAALAARRYALGGELVLDVTDDAIEVPVAGRYRLSADPDPDPDPDGDGDGNGSGGGVGCEATDDDPDVTLTARALASIYLGGFRVHELATAGAIVERTPGALHRLSAMFATDLAPWNATGF